MDEVERVEVGEQANPLPTYIKARDEGKLPLKWLTPAKICFLREMDTKKPG
jgi:hypothetical protein